MDYNVSNDPASSLGDGRQGVTFSVAHAELTEGPMPNPKSEGGNDND